MSRTSKITTLSEAIRTHVRSEMHLNFGSTPFRSNAAIRELARVWRGRDPRFVLSATGFHSTAHLLPLLGLGRRYISTFFGDNYPIPRPNALYSRVGEHGAELEFWSLSSYVTALRAGAMGHRHAVTNSLIGSTMGEKLAELGRFHVVDMPGEHGVETVGMVKAMRPDVTFVHGLAADSRGNVLFSKPACEGFWGALAAREGVIATVERIVDDGFCAEYPDAIGVPPHRVLAVCHVPYGAHPQPLLPLPYADLTGYPDDFDHYLKWREMTRDPERFQEFVEAVLDAGDGERAYRKWVGEERLKRLRRSRKNLPPETPAPRARTAGGRSEAWTSSHPEGMVKANTAQIILAARVIRERVKAEGYPVILAGIGHSFLAARMARLWLEREGVDVSVMIEIGMFDVECGPSCHPFLLSYDNMNQAERLTSVEDVLTACTCGADNRCLGVLGAGQIDPTGDINSTWIAPDRMLVGSGGANDIASSAAEVVVLTRMSASRLVDKVDYVTSPGRRVTRVVTGAGVLSREDTGSTDWTLSGVYPVFGGRPLDEVVQAIAERCTWSFDVPEAAALEAPISTEELQLLYSLDPEGDHWAREAR